MINRIKTIVILFLFAASSIVVAQVSNVKLNHNVYSFLSTLSQKGIISYDDLVKPLSRRYVAEKLLEAGNDKSKLTSLQKEELEFYKAEFGYELGKIQGETSKVKSEKSKVKSQKSKVKSEKSKVKSEKPTGHGIKETNNKSKINEQKTDNKKRDLFDKSWQFEVRKPKGVEEKADEAEKNSELRVENTGSEANIKFSGEKYTFVEKDPYKRWRFFGYENNIMNININPKLGYEIGNWEKLNYRSLHAGITFYGEIGDIVGFNFDLHTRRLEPGTIRSFPLFNTFSPNTTIDIQLGNRERIEASEVNVDIGAKWDWGSVTIGKNHLNWGYAENGKIVLSEKAPSFPYVRLDLKPTPWFSFNYIHAWLNSDVVDTSSFHSSWRYRGNENTDKRSYIGKYMAMHSVSFYFLNGITLSLGESAVYSGNFQLAYLIPIMFFDIADEYLNRSDNYFGASTQLFLAASSRNHIPNTHLYASFHADELTPEGLFDPAIQYYKFAFTFGASTVDLPIDNLGLRVEYTKIYPGNYRHFIPSLTYESSSTLMGHWMGDNGDLFYAAIDYTIQRGLKVKLWTQHIRKGTEALGNRAYKIQIPQPGFLFTDNLRDRKNYAYYGVDVQYEFMHDVWVKAHYQYIDYEQQITEGNFRSTLNRDISFTFGYGI